MTDDSPMAGHRRTITRRRTMAVAFAAAAIAVVAACTPPPDGENTKSVSNAAFEWTVSNETNNGAFDGSHNFWAAGQSTGTEAQYKATDGNAAVLKKNASGTYVPIGSESAVSYANRGKDGTGAAVTAFSPNFLGQKVRFSNGTGTVDTATGAATIQWTGSFTIHFYGPLAPFWITDPKLVVQPDGSAKLSATLGGFAGNQADPTQPPTPLPTTPDVTVAEFSNVYAGGAIATGWTKATNYVGTVVSTAVGAAPQVAKTPANETYWGAWPQSFVNFQNATGLSSYWYTSGTGSINPGKAQDPVTVSYSLNP